MDKTRSEKYCVPSGSIVKDAIQTLNNQKGKIVIVLNSENVVVGTITDGDVRRSLLDGVTVDCPVEKVMNKDFLFIKQENYSEQKARELFIKHSIKQLPILNRVKALESLNNCDICLLIQHTDQRSRLTIPYKLYDYLNTNKLIFGLTSNNELNELLVRGGHFFADSRSIQSIEIVLKDLINKKENNSFNKPVDLKININEQTKKIFE